MKRLVILFLLMASGALAQTTYYVDYANGSDSNNGTSETTAWKHAPGMQGLTPSGSSTGDGCTANCASYSPSPGDKIILRGGTVWPYTTMPWYITWSGGGSTSTYGCQGSGCIYIGNAVGAGLSSWNTGTVTGIWLNRDLGGWNPASPPTISCSGGGGSGAAATPYVVPSTETNDPNIAGFIYNISLTSGGSGYTSAPTCVLSGGGGTATLGADIDRAIIDWGALTGTPPQWLLGTGSFIPNIHVTGQYVILNGLVVRNSLIGGLANSTEQPVFVQLSGQNDTASNNFLHDVYSTCGGAGNCNSVDVNHDALQMESPYDEAAGNVIENGGSAIIGTSPCTSGLICTFLGFGIHDSNQTGNGPVSVHNNVIYSNRWQLRLQGSDASGNDPYLSYGNEIWLTTYDYNSGAHVNTRYMQFGAAATLISYNNVVHSGVGGSSSQLQCPQGMSYTFYNEVQWNLGNGTQAYSLDMADVGGAGGCTLALYNDTMYWPGVLVNSQTGSNVSTITMQNLFCISSSVVNPFWSTGITNSVYQNYASSTTQATVQASSVVDSLSGANGQGYEATNLFAPTASSNETVTFSSNANSANLTSLCSGYLTSLCSDINGYARPTTGGWQAGAYQLGSGTGTGSAPAAPTGLTASVN